MRATWTRPLRLLVVVLAAAGLAAACGDSDGGDADNELVEYFVSQDAPRDEAECVAGELSNYSAAEVIAAFEADEAPSDEGMLDDIFAAVESCGLTE